MNLEDNSAEFIDGLHRLQRLLNVPSKDDDTTSVLQAISKLVSEKLSANAVKEFTAKQNSSTTSKNDVISIKFMI